VANELESYQGGDLAPYGTGTGLQPYSPQDDWGNTDVDYLAERQVQPSPDVQLQAVYAEVGRVIASDMIKLGHPQAWVSATLNWYQQHIGRDPGRVQRKHRFNLHDQAGDALAEAFGNHCAKIGASQEYVSNVLWLLGEAAKRLTGAPQQVQQAAVSSDPTDALSDADYDRVVAINDQAAAATKGYLADLWGSSYQANMRVVQQYYQNLPTADQEFLSQFAQNWVKGTNSVDVLLGLYRQAIGSGTLPKSGAEISREIASIENVMKHERAKYMKDDQLQARYRELLRLRGY